MVLSNRSLGEMREIKSQTGMRACKAFECTTLNNIWKADKTVLFLGYFMIEWMTFIAIYIISFFMIIIP